MYGAYREKDELAVIFVANHDDYKGMTFEKQNNLQVLMILALISKPPLLAMKQGVV